MKRLFMLSAKVAGAAVLAGASLWFSSDTEVLVGVGTALLAIAAAATLCLSANRAVQSSAAVVLALVPVCQHAVDLYFWSGVHAHGLPWPWAGTKQASIASVAPQAGQVADVSFYLLTLIVALVAARHLTLRSSGPPSASAELKR